MTIANVMKVTLVFEIVMDEKNMDAPADAAMAVKEIEQFIGKKENVTVADKAWKIERRRIETPPAPSVTPGKSGSEPKD